MTRFKPNASEVTIHHWSEFKGGVPEQVWEVTWDNAETWTAAQERPQHAKFKALKPALVKVAALLTAENEDDDA